MLGLSKTVYLLGEWVTGLVRLGRRVMCGSAFLEYSMPL
jgi:hypothetical protein